MTGLLKRRERDRNVHYGKSHGRIQQESVHSKPRGVVMRNQSFGHIDLQL